MIVYQKDGKDYLLMTNSSRGVMKIPTEGAGDGTRVSPSPVPGGGKKGLGYETIASLKGVAADGPARQDPRRDPRQSGTREP